MIIDFHTHAFPERIAGRAVEKLSFASGGLKPHTDGTIAGLKEHMQKNGICKSVVLNIATNEHQQQSVNDFAAAMCDDSIIGFGSVFPQAANALEELERIAAMGLKGVKLHPDYQGFFVDDEKLIPLYKKISSLGLITVFHAGLDYGFAPPYGATPERLAKALKHFSSPVVAAHFGGCGCGEGVLKYLCGTDIYFDTSFGYATQPKYYIQKILEAHPTERILFGTDAPWHTAEMEQRLFATLDLGDSEREMILHLNAERILDIRL